MTKEDALLILEAPEFALRELEWADGYERGLSVQTSLNRALAQQGCVSEGWTRNSHVIWAERERDFIESILTEQYGYTIVHPDAGKYKESIPWRVYAQEQEALKRIDDQKVKLSAMLREADDMEAELEMKRQELEEVTEATCAIEEMKTIEMPDGRSLWEHNMARVREERERSHRSRVPAGASPSHSREPCPRRCVQGRRMS